MPDREKLIVVCKEWLFKADNDLANAAHTPKEAQVMNQFRRTRRLGCLLTFLLITSS